MDLSTALILAFGTAVLCATIWGGCRWWYGRRLHAWSLRLDKSEKARQLSIQQTMQARKQIERLQKELAAQPRATMQAKAVPPRVVDLEAVLQAGDAAGAGPRLPANGFADTQPMESRQRR